MSEPSSIPCGEATIARVVIENGPAREFDYRIPDSLRDRVRPGVRVRIPFGNRTARGTVTDLRDHSERTGLRSLIGVADASVTLAPNLLSLSQWISAYYGASPSAVHRAMLPAPMRKRDDGGGFERLYVTPAPVATDGADAPKCDSPRGPATKRQRDVLAHIESTGGGWLSEIRRALQVSTDLLRKLEVGGFVTIAARRIRHDPLDNRTILPSSPLTLMPEQHQALGSVVAACERHDAKPLLLHGVTGSGKTEVYLQAIGAVLDAGRGAIVLVPEIALTPQTMQRFVARFGSRVALLHSALGDGRRHEAWTRLLSGEARVAVGPRSAVFAPVANLGLIVVDEEHEPSYKQDETPRYHARDVAVVRARLERCAVVLGSATPSLESWRNVTIGKYELLRLPRRVDDRQMPAVRIVDMRRETARAGRIQVFSRALIEAVERRLDVGEQIMLFLNRRGYASALVCGRCGYVDECSNCSVTRTYHRDDERLCCHICGASEGAPAVCPGCADPGFRYAGIGTQRIEIITRKFFPRARIQRMDADVTRRRRSHDEILTDFRARRIDILVGTQMIAKGLDFPNVTLVGVLMADMSMHQPDFRAGERTYQLLAQMAGRAGRGEIPGEVIVQTYTPHHPAVEAAARDDYVSFADAELADREPFGFPPFRRLICLTFRARDEARAANAAETLHAALRGVMPADGSLSEAVPAPLKRARGQYRYQVMLRVRDPRLVTSKIVALLDTIRRPHDVAVALDVDAMNIL